MAKNLPKVKGSAKMPSKKGSGKQFLKDFGRNLLGEFGLQSEHFKPGGFVHGKLGLYSQAVKKTSIDKGPEMPALVKPKTAPNVSNPSISSIAKQLSALVKISKAIGLMTKKQQDALVKQVVQADRAAKESALESGANAELVQNNLAGGDSIQPVNDALLDLAKQLSKLTDAVREKVDGQGGSILGAVAGAASLFHSTRGSKTAGMAKAVRRPKLNKGFSSFVDSGGATRFRSSATGRYVSRADAVKAPLLQRAGKAVASSALSSKVGGLMSAGMRRAATKSGAVQVASAAMIKKLAGPIVAKGLGRTVLKSIPVIGTVAGLGFAAKRLLEGDPVGAGLDAVSGLGSAMTAVPAFIASVARDVYTQVFGVHPEEDPNAGTRLAMVTEAVKSLVEETLRPRLTPKNKPSQATSLSSHARPPAPPAQKESGSTMTTPQIVPAPAKDSGGTSTPNSSGGGGGGGSPAAPAQSAPASGGGAAASASPAGQITPKPEQSNYSKPEDAQKVAPSPSAGAGIVELTQENAALETSNLAPKITINGVEVPSPSFTPTTRNGARGMGNVPDPNYYRFHPDLPAQLYFSAAA